MKNILLYVLFVCTFSAFAQNKDSIANVVKGNFERAEKLLNDNDIRTSMYRYHSAILTSDKYQITDSVTEHLRTTSRKRIDSLLPVVLNESFMHFKKNRNRIGKWKLTQLKENEYFSYQYIEITDDKILFYDENSDTPSRIEEIKFPSYEHFYESFHRESFCDIVVEFKNGEIWEFSWYGESYTGGGKPKYFLIPFIRRLENGTETKGKQYNGIKENRTYYTLIKQ